MACNAHPWGLRFLNKPHGTVQHSKHSFSVDLEIRTFLQAQALHQRGKACRGLWVVRRVRRRRRPLTWSVTTRNDCTCGFFRSGMPSGSIPSQLMVGPTSFTWLLRRRVKICAPWSPGACHPPLHIEQQQFSSRT